MPLRSLLLHVLLCLALVANGAGAAWAGTRGDCCSHATPAAAPASTPCHDADMTMAPPHLTSMHETSMQDMSMHGMSMHGMPAHDGHPLPPHGTPKPCDGHCVCMTHVAGTLPPAPPRLGAAPVRDTLVDALVRPHAPPALPHPLRPPIRA
jgi:hypothetical protein